MYNTKAFYRHDAFIGSNRYNQFISSIGDKVTSGCMYGALKFLNEISEYSMTRYEGRYDDILSMDHRKNYEKRKKVILCAAKACLSENDIFKQIPLRKSPDTLAHDILNCIYQMCIGKFMGDLIYGMKDDEKKQIVEKLDKMIAEKISSPKDRYTNLDKLMDNIWTMFLWTCNTELETCCMNENDKKYMGEPFQLVKLNNFVSYDLFDEATYPLFESNLFFRFFVHIISSACVLILNMNIEVSPQALVDDSFADELLKENESLQKEIDGLKSDLREAQIKIKHYENIADQKNEKKNRINKAMQEHEHEILQKEKAYQKLLEKYQTLKSDYEDLGKELDLVNEENLNSCKEDDLSDKVIEELNIDFNAKYIFVGGHYSTVAKLRKLFPKAIFILKETETIQPNMIKDLDHVVYLSRFMNHCMYKNVRDKIKGTNIPEFHSMKIGCEAILKDMSEFGKFAQKR